MIILIIILIQIIKIIKIIVIMMIISLAFWLMALVIKTSWYLSWSSSPLSSDS